MRISVGIFNEFLGDDLSLESELIIFCGILEGLSKMDHPVFRSTFHKYRKIVRAIFARCILIGHSTVAVYLTVQLLGDVRYYGIYGVAIPLFLGELAIILYAQQGCEWRR